VNTLFIGISISGLRIEIVAFVKMALKAADISITKNRNL
tara:strand:+ start:420 stop:536 length:117 start_codon:yes stop_codon:yes gene_type:complete